MRAYHDGPDYDDYQDQQDYAQAGAAYAREGAADYGRDYAPDYADDYGQEHAYDSDAGRGAAAERNKPRGRGYDRYEQSAAAGRGPVDADYGYADEQPYRDLRREPGDPGQRRRQGGPRQVSTRQSFPTRAGHFEQLLKMMWTDIKKLLGTWFSSHTDDAFRFELSQLTWIGIFAFNLLFMAIASGRLYFVLQLPTSLAHSKMAGFFGSEITSVGAYFKAFLLGLVNQFLFFGLTLLFLMLLNMLFKPKNRDALQLLKTVAVAAFPMTLLMPVVMILSFAYLPAALILMRLLQVLYILGIFVGYTVKHQPKPNMIWPTLVLCCLLYYLHF